MKISASNFISGRNLSYLFYPKNIFLPFGEVDALTYCCIYCISFDIYNC